MMPPGACVAQMESAMTGEPRKTAWHRTRDGLGLVGRQVGRAAVQASKAAAQAWDAVDPDLLRHAAQLPVMGLTLLGPSHRPLAPLPDDGYRPILFVHGLGGHRSNFAPMRLWFRLHGRSRTYAVGFRPELTLDEMAIQLRVAIAEALTGNGLAPEAQVDLVSHSMGGIIARLALEDAATAQRVAHLVTLGTPHAGTQAARFARTPHIRDLRPDSAIMARLATQLPWRGPPLTSLWSHSDLLLLPASTALVEGAENIEMPAFTHYSYLLDVASARRVFASLSQ